MRSFRFPPAYSIDMDITEFKLFIEELEHGAKLLQSHRVAKERMALVILDSLADRLLYQHAHRHFEYAEEMMWRRDRQYTAHEQGGILRDFGRKVNLALKEAEWPYPNPLLDDLDAAIFRVAHNYRNAGYHRNEHNDVLIGPLGRLYAQAVARALLRSAGDWMRAGLDDKLVADLDRFDWRDPDRSRGQFSPKPAAERIGAQIVAPLTVDTAKLAEQLVSDSEERCDAVQEMMESPRCDGATDELIDTMLEAALHWARHRGDPDMLELQEEQQRLIDEASNGPEVSDEHLEVLLQNERAQFARIEQLHAKTEIKFDLGSVASLTCRAGRLRTERRLAPLLQRYQVLDEELRLLEATAERMAREWDRFVQHQIDVARGK